MIDAKQAIQIAKQSAAEILGQPVVNVEEIERDSYKDREIWSITLSSPRDMEQLSPVVRINADPLTYRRFLIDAETGEVHAVKLRETSAR